MDKQNRLQNKEETLKNAAGGYSDYSKSALHQQSFVIRENEARILNIKSGTYARDDLANAILENTPNLSSSQYQAIASQNTAAKMRAALESIGLKRDENFVK